MLKSHTNPYGYKNLLLYKKAEELQVECQKIAGEFAKTKTLISLADQMNRSARSIKQNIVEGWKRNSTNEYHQFLGFSAGANNELEEDCDDIWKGIYPELMGIKGLMGEKGEKGLTGEKGERRFTDSANPPVKPFCPIRPLDITKLKFYPLDKTLPPVIQLKLRCGEINYLLSKLQKSLEIKMVNDMTLSMADKLKLQKEQNKREDVYYEKMLEKNGLIRLENGKIVRKERGLV